MFWKNFCGVIRKRTGISMFWSVNNSAEFVKKIINIPAKSIYTYDFTSLYTNLPHSAVISALESIVVKAFNKKSYIYVNAKREHATFSTSEQMEKNKQYRKYSVDQVIDAIKFILNNAYVQFAGDIFQQIIGIIMGGNACPEIADLYLIWCEYDYMQKLCSGKTKNLQLAKELSNNSRYIDDISTLNLSINFGTLSKVIYDNSLVLEQSSDSGLRDNFLDLHIYIKNGKFVTGIYHKVDDFDFEVISYPFPNSNVTNSEGPKCFYSQLIRFARLCNTATNFCTRLHNTYMKLHHRGYDSRALVNRFNQFCENTTDWLAYGKSQREIWKMAFKYDDHIFFNINDNFQINNAVKSCYIQLSDIQSNYKHDEKLNSGYKKLLSVWQQQTSHSEYQDADTADSEDSIGTVIVNENHGYKIIGLDNPANFCYLNSIIQVLICILLHSGCTYQHTVTNQRLFANAFLNFKFKEGFKLQYRKRNLHIIRSWFTKGKTAIPLLNGLRQQDAHEAFLKLTSILHDGTKQCIIPDLPHNLIEDSMLTSFPRFLFRFPIEKTYTCEICNKQSNIQEFIDELTVNSEKYNNINKMINECWTATIKKVCIYCKVNTAHSTKIKVLKHPRVLRLIVLRFNNNLEKIDKPIDINTNITIFGKKLSLLGMINHHGNNVKNGHYTATVQYNSWWNADDKQITPFSLKLLNNNTTAYLVFYRQ